MVIVHLEISNAEKLEAPARMKGKGAEEMVKEADASPHLDELVSSLPFRSPIEIEIDEDLGFAGPTP
jgi:hypothetical protein